MALSRIGPFMVIEAGLVLPENEPVLRSLRGGDFAKLLGTKPNHFAHKFPDCWSLIVERRRAHVQRNVVGNLERLALHIRDTATEWQRAGINVSHCALEVHYLQNERKMAGLLGYTELRNLIRKVLAPLKSVQ